MRKLYVLLLILFASLTVNEIKAQDYQSAIGGKVGYGFIGTYKKFIGEAPAIDLYAGFGFFRGFVLGANYQHHMDIGGVDRLRWFLGGGASLLTFSYNSAFISGGYVDVAINFNIGLDYSFADIPLNLGVEYAPAFVVFSSYDKTFLNSYNRFRGGYAGASARYILSY